MGLSHLQQSEHLHGQRPLSPHTCKEQEPLLAPKQPPPGAPLPAARAAGPEKLISGGTVPETPASPGAHGAQCEEGRGPFRWQTVREFAHAPQTSSQKFDNFSKVIKKSVFVMKRTETSWSGMRNSHGPLR